MDASFFEIGISGFITGLACQSCFVWATYCLIIRCKPQHYIDKDFLLMGDREETP